MNAYLPSLARDSPEVVEAQQQLDKASGSTDIHAPLPTSSIDLDADHALLSDTESSVSAPLLGTTSPDHQSPVHKAYVAALSRATSRISAQGIASGYAAGILLLLLALVPVKQMHGSTFSLRLAIGLSGAWWILFSIPAALWLPGGSGSRPRGNDKWTVGSEVVSAWKRLGVMLRWSQIKRLQHTFRYLAAWFLLSDGTSPFLARSLTTLTLVLGFTTITSTAILFGKTTLHMPSSSLVLIGAITPACGILGSLVFPALQRRFGWSNLYVLVLLVLLVSCIPAYGCLGFVPFVRRLRVGGLTTPGEMFGLAVYFGASGFVRAWQGALT